MSTKIYKKFASLERRVGETFHVANDFVRCLSHCVGEVFQNLFYAQNNLFILLTFISDPHFLKYYNILKRKKQGVILF